MYLVDIVFIAVTPVWILGEEVGERPRLKFRGEPPEGDGFGGLEMRRVADEVGASGLSSRCKCK